MVRQMQEPRERGQDPFMPARKDAHEKKDGKSTANKGYDGLLQIPMVAYPSGCGDPWTTWGFDESFPSVLGKHIAYNEWMAAMQDINTGYLTSFWPKLIWIPFVFCLIAGAITEGMTYKDERAHGDWYTGVTLLIFASGGFFFSLIMWRISKYRLSKEPERVEIVCSLLTERYRNKGLTWSIRMPVSKNHPMPVLEIKMHVTDVNIKFRHVKVHVDEADGDVQDSHTIRTEVHEDHVVQTLTDRRAPASALPPGRVFKYGRGVDPVVVEKEKKPDDESSSSEDGEDVEEIKEITPHGGWCGCHEVTRKISFFWKGGKAKTVSAAFIWRNRRFDICPVCSLPIYNQEEAIKASMGDVDVSKRHQGLEIEADLCGDGWSTGFFTGFFSDCYMSGEACFCQICFVAKLCMVLEGRDSCTDNPIRYFLFQMLAITCFPIHIALRAYQRRLIRGRFNIDISRAPFGTLMDGKVHDCCAVMLGCAADVQHANEMSRREQPVWLCWAPVVEEEVPVQLSMADDEDEESEDENRDRAAVLAAKRKELARQRQAEKAARRDAREERDRAAVRDRFMDRVERTQTKLADPHRPPPLRYVSDKVWEQREAGAL